jgi:hypothetical protein
MLSMKVRNLSETAITDDGLKMQIYNRSKKPLFKDNTIEFTEWGNFVFSKPRLAHPTLQLPGATSRATRQKASSTRLQ